MGGKKRRRGEEGEGEGEEEEKEKVTAQFINIIQGMLFQLYERLYQAVEELALPFPRGFNTSFASLGLKCLPRGVFLQCVDRGIITLTPTFLRDLLLRNNDLDEGKKVYSPLPSLPLPFPFPFPLFLTNSSRLISFCIGARLQAATSTTPARLPQVPRAPRIPSHQGHPQRPSVPSLHTRREGGRERGNERLRRHDSPHRTRHFGSSTL